MFVRIMIIAMLKCLKKITKFDTTKNKPDYYRGEDFMKNFFIDLREHDDIINKRRK